MARYLGDQNKVGMFGESGTYASPSGTYMQWIGLVSNNAIEDVRNTIPKRTEGAGTRNIVQTVYTTVDAGTTLTYDLQDFRLIGYALGSFVSTSGPNCSHFAVETNSDVGNAFTSGTTAPFISFTLQDSKKGAAANNNFIRTLYGNVVNNFTMSWTQGEPITAEVNTIAQSCIFASGTIATVTENTLRPLIWKDLRVHIPSGTTFDTTKGSFSINNNVDRRHVTNGSAEIDRPVPLNRDYLVTLTMDMSQETTKSLYEPYYIAGSSFNMMIAVDASNAIAGSRSTYIILSGCNITTPLTQPSPMEGINEETITIVPESCNVNAYDRIGTNGKWGIW